MSFSSNRRNALDATQPLVHRASRARSCAMLVAQKLGIDRDVVIARIRELTGVDMHVIEALEGLRVRGLR